MTKIDFYYMPESPPCRAVEMVANMVGVELKKHYLNLMDKEHLSEEYVKLNPLHKVPFIVDGDLKLNESRAIMAYLVNKYKPNDEHLYPKEPKIRAQIDELLYHDMGTLYQSASKLLHPKFFGAVELNKEDEEKFRNNLAHLEMRLGQNRARRFLLNDHISIADIAICVTLSFVTAAGYSLQDYKHITAYIERLRAAIPKYAEINDVAIENLKKFVESKQAK